MSNNKEKCVTKETIIPITWFGWDEIDVMAVMFYNVTFLEDWGHYKKGQEIDKLYYSQDKGIVEYNVDGEEVKVTNVKLVPV